MGDLRSVIASRPGVALGIAMLFGCQKFGTGDTPLSSSNDGGGGSSPSTVDGGDAGVGAPPSDASTLCNTAQPMPCEAPCEGGGRCQSCSAILARYPGIPSGVFAIERRNNAAQPLPVYCDMTSFGGGWLLIGRSVDNPPSSRMGWKVDEGDAFNDNASYSLDTQQLAFEPIEMAFGSRAGNAKAWGANVYRAPLPAGFAINFATKALAIFSTRTALKGSCSGGHMQSFIGLTNKTDSFFFRDNSGDDQFGLRSDGFDTNGDMSCTGGGLLGAQQGMIFVR